MAARIKRKHKRLSRFFLPRGMDFKNLYDGYLENVASLLNNRPRKCLGLKSPIEVYCCTCNYNLPPYPLPINSVIADNHILAVAFSVIKAFIRMTEYFNIITQIVSRMHTGCQGNLNPVFFKFNSSVTDFFQYLFKPGNCLKFLCIRHVKNKFFSTPAHGNIFFFYAFFNNPGYSLQNLIPCFMPVSIIYLFIRSA